MKCHLNAKSGCEHIICDYKSFREIHNFSIEILEKLTGKSYDHSGHRDASITQICLKREPQGPLKLRTYHPNSFKKKGSAGSNNSNIDEVALGKIFQITNSPDYTEIITLVTAPAKIFSINQVIFFKIIYNDSFQIIHLLLNNNKRKTLKNVAFLS